MSYGKLEVSFDDGVISAVSTWALASSLRFLMGSGCREEIHEDHKYNGGKKSQER